MKTMIPEIYDALISAGADDAKARAAATVLTDFDANITEIRTTLKRHGWMLTTLLALNVTMLWEVFSL